MSPVAILTSSLFFNFLPLSNTISFLLFCLLSSLFSLHSIYHPIPPHPILLLCPGCVSHLPTSCVCLFHLQALYCIDPTLRCAIPVAKPTDDLACLVVRLIVKTVLGPSLFVYKLGVLSWQLSPFLLRPASISLNNSIQVEPRPYLLYDIAEYCLSSEVLTFQLVAP